MGTSYPISAARSIYSSPRRNAAGEMDIQQNYSRIGDPQIDQLFEQATSELDHAKAVELANQLDAKIWAIGHSLALYQRPEIVVARTNLVNFGAWGFADWVFEDTGWLKPAH